MLYSTLRQSRVMSQSIPTVYIPPPPGKPRENLFERVNPGHPGKSFCLIPCPRAKNDAQIPRGWGKIFPNSKKLPLKLAKNSSRNSENYETVQIFYLENLRKLLYFRLKQNHSKVFNYSSLQYFN